MEPREKGGCLKCLRIFFIVCFVVAVVFGLIYIFLYIINPTALLNEYDKSNEEISDAQAREKYLLELIWTSIEVPLTCFGIYALYKDNVKLLWVTFALFIVLTIGLFITGIHWIALVPSLFAIIAFGCYVHILSKFQKSLKFDRNLRV